MAKPPRPTNSPYSNAIYTTVTPVIGALVVILNVIELFCIRKLQRKRRQIKASKSIIYIISLCVSDILVGVVMIVLKSMDPFMKTSLKGDVIANEFYSIMKHVFIRLSMFVSIFNMLALTFDRFLAMTAPLRHRKYGKSFVFKIIGCVWFLSVACVTAIYCVSRFKLSNVEKYNNMVFPISAYSATVVFFATYSIIYKVIRDSNEKKRKTSRNRTMRVVSRKTLNQQQQSDRAVSVKGKKTSDQPQQSDRAVSVKGRKKSDQPQEKTTMKQEIRFLRLAVLTVGVFCLSWLPFSTCNLLIVFGRSCGGKDIERTLFTLAFSNSILNPLVYFFHNLKNIKEIFSRKATTYSTVQKSHSTSLSSIKKQGRLSTGRLSSDSVETRSSSSFGGSSEKRTSTYSMEKSKTNAGYECEFDNDVFEEQKEDLATKVQ